MDISMVNEAGICSYRVVRLDDAISVRLVGPDGRQHRLLSLALTAMMIHAGHASRSTWRYIAAFRELLNVVEAKFPDAADDFVSSVQGCRRTVDRYLVNMSVKSRDIGGGARWVRPPSIKHRIVADALVAVGKVTRFLTRSVYGGQDPSKVDPAFSRTNGIRSTNVGRNGIIRVDTDRRLRIGADPTVAPRLDDPLVYDRWADGLGRMGTGEVFVRVLAMLRHAGMRCFQALGLTLHDVFVLGGGRTLPVPNKGDATRERTLRKKLSPEQLDLLMSYVEGERARITGVSLRDIRVIARDPLRRDDLKGVPLFTENGEDHVTYDRLRRVTHVAAVKMDLVLNDREPDEADCKGNPDRYVVLHMLRHEYVHERLTRIDGIALSGQAAARRELIRYMGWRGEAMLRWYSEHYRVGAAGNVSMEHNRRLDAVIGDRTTSVDRKTYDLAFDAALAELA